MGDFIVCRFVLARKKFKREMIDQIVNRLSEFEEVITREEWVKRNFKDLLVINKEAYLKHLEGAKQQTNCFEICDRITNNPLGRLLTWGEDKKAPKETIGVRLSGDDRFHSPLNFAGDVPWDELDKETREYALTATNNFVRDAKIIYDTIRPDYGFAGWTEASLEITEEDLKEPLFWLNFYGPAMAKRIGKQKLLSAPAYHVEELKDGGVFLRLNETWLNLNTINNADLKQEIAVAKHLGFKRPIQKILEYSKGSTEEHQKELKKIIEETQ